MDRQFTLDELHAVVAALRGENGCPWDRAQTHESMKSNTIEEAYEVNQAVSDLSATGQADNLCEELGDLLFSAVNAARFLKVDPEDALNGATDKFIGRFRKVEAQAAAQGKAMEDMGLEELDALWERAKET